MAITSVKLTQEGTGLSGNGVSVEKVRRSYKAHYRVTTDDPATSTKAVELHFRNGRDADNNPLPYYGRTWKWYGANGDKDVDAICNRFEVSHQPSSYGIFTVEVGFEPEQDETKTKEGKDGKSDDPIDWLDSIDVSYTQISVPVEKATFEGFNRAGIANRFLIVGNEHTPCNSALVPYDPPLEELLQIKVIRIGSYVTDINDSDDWQDYINDADFTIDKMEDYAFKQAVKKWCGWLKSVGGRYEYINQENWYRREVELWINPLGWVQEILDKGLMQRAAADDVKAGRDDGATWSQADILPGNPVQHPIKGKNGIPVTSPCLLDGNGQPLQDLENPVFLKWRTKRQKNLANFDW